MQYTFTIPIVTMILLMMFGLTLEGAFDGLYELIKPDFRNLINPFVWADAGRISKQSQHLIYCFR